MQANLQALDLIYADCEAVIENRLNSLEKLKNKMIYIAGGTGFVGIWTATLLHYLNSHYNFNTRVILLARHPDILYQIAPHLGSNEKISMLEKDVRSVFEIPSEVNYILHAACNPDSRYHALNPLEIASVISDGTKNLLAASERCSYLENFLYLSSAAIYGYQLNDVVSITEDFLGSAPQTNSVLSAYGESKRFAEVLCSIYRSQFRLPTVIARPFSFIGPYQSIDKPWAINNFIQDVLNGEEIKVFGNGKTVRTYLYGSDVAFWLLNMIANANAGDVYNVGSEEAISIDALANLVADASLTKTEIINSNIPMDSSKASRLVPSIAVAKTKLNCEVTVALNSAIHKTIEWNKLCQK